MTTYTSIPNGDIDQDSPATQPLFQLLRDNPIAITEGASGAPRVQGKAIGGTFLAYQAVSSTTAAVWTGLAGMETIRLEASYGPFNSASLIQIAFSNDNGVNYGSYQTLFSNPAAATAAGLFAARINLRTGAADGFISGAAASVVGTTGGVNTTLTVPSSCNAFRVRSSSGTFNMNAIAWCLGGLEA